MAVDMTTLLHQGLQKGKPDAPDALAVAREQVLANARGGSADAAQAAPEAAPEAAQDAPEQTPAPEEEPAGQSADGPSGAQGPGDGDDAPSVDGDSAGDGAARPGDAGPASPDGDADDEPKSDADAAPAGGEGAPGHDRPQLMPIEVAADVVSETCDMDTQAEMGGTDRAVAGEQAAKVASPPRRKKEPIATNVKPSVGGAEQRQVRGIAQSTINVARAAFPTMSYGDAINAYVAWKSGDLSGLSEDAAKLVRQKAADEADPLVSVNNTLNVLERKMNKQMAAIGELEVYTVFVMLDRLGFRPASAMATVSDVDLNVIKDVPTVMPKLSKQAEEIRRRVEQKKGRPQRNASLPSQDVI